MINFLDVVKWVLLAVILLALCAAVVTAFSGIPDFGGTQIDAIKEGQQIEIGGVPGKSLVLWLVRGLADPHATGDYGWLTLAKVFVTGFGVLAMAVLAWLS